MFLFARTIVQRYRIRLKSNPNIQRRLTEREIKRGSVPSKYWQINFSELLKWKGYKHSLTQCEIDLTGKSNHMHVKYLWISLIFGKNSFFASYIWAVKNSSAPGCTIFVACHWILQKFLVFLEENRNNKYCSKNKRN